MPTWPPEGELPPPGDAAFDALLDHAPLPDGTTAPLHQLAAAFGELYAVPVDSAPGAGQYTMAMFRAAAGRPAVTQPVPTQPVPTQPVPTQPVPTQPVPTQPVPARSGRRRARRPRFSVRVAAIGTAVLVSLGGAAATAAYTGALPDMLHRLTQHHPASPPATAPGSAAQPTTESGSAAPGTAPGLCTAYQHARADGSPSAQRKAFRKLVAAAGGTGNVTSYCAGVVQPQPTPGGQHTHPSHPAHPTHSTHPTHPAHPTHPPHPSHSPK